MTLNRAMFIAYVVFIVLAIPTIIFLSAPLGYAFLFLAGLISLGGCLGLYLD